jgi:hypothetical protein
VFLVSLWFAADMRCANAVPTDRRKEVAMALTIVASFETRRDAETSVEHLVQEYGIARADIFVSSPGKANTAGTRPAGADVASGHPGADNRGEPELSGPIEVSVECEPNQSTLVKSALERAGGFNIRTE